MTLPEPSYPATKICISKTCVHVGVPQPLANFHRKPIVRSGLESICKFCAAARDRAYNKLHAEKKRAQCREWYIANREKQKNRSRMWRFLNPEKAMQTKRQYYESNTAKCREANAAHRARKYAAPIRDFTHKQWIELQARYDHRCAYCGEMFKGKLTRDHVIPLSKGGNHTASNIVPACFRCNASKGNRDAPLRIQV